MTKHFVTAFVAISAFVATASHGALARAQAGIAAPSVPAGAFAWVGETGTASYYGPAYNGKRSASGARFDQQALTAAHPWLPFGTKIRVMLAGTSRSVIVTVTDRIYSTRRVIDLSVAAAIELGMIRRGIAQVTIAPA